MKPSQKDSEAAIRYITGHGEVQMDELRRRLEARQILAAARSGAGELNAGLLLASGAVEGPYTRAGKPATKYTRQAGNVARICRALWKYVTGPKAF
jgi:hypothetical protein